MHVLRGARLAPRFAQDDDKYWVYGCTAIRSGLQVWGMLLHRLLLLLLLLLTKVTSCRSTLETVLKTCTEPSVVPTYMVTPSLVRLASRGTGLPVSGMAVTVFTPRSNANTLPRLLARM